MEDFDRHGRKPDPLPGLPPELRELEDELLSIEISERASFGPELKAELERAWLEEARQRPRHGARSVLAAGIATVLMIALGVPPARAALARFLVAVQDEVFSRPEDPGQPEVRFEPPPAEVLADMPTRLGPVTPPVGGSEEGASSSSAFTVPTLHDRPRAEALIRSFYPKKLADEGIGGVARVLLWVDDAGRVAESRLEGSSGIAELDRAALAAAPSLVFQPASRGGQRVGSWLEFDVRFVPPAPEPAPIPVVATLEHDELPDGVGGDLELRPEWLSGNALIPPPSTLDARDFLRDAIGTDRDVVRRWGRLEELLAGEAPPDELPLRWREDAVEALETALIRDPGNPAPFLALARIRRKQGLWSDARRLYERGIDRAEHLGSDVPPSLEADLFYEHATMIRELWLPWQDLGRVPSGVLETTSSCYRAPTPRSSDRYASGDILNAWNFLCPGHFDQLMHTEVEAQAPLAEDDRERMLRSYYGAVEADPGHVRAYTEVLLSLSDAGRWEEVLEEGHYFLSGSSGHPYAQLFIGMALHRLGRSNDASLRFHQALALLPDDEARSIRDLSPLLSAEEAADFAGLEGPTREAAIRNFWTPLDPLLTTPVNEREIEHLARASYVLLRYGDVLSDPGQVWIRYGRPNAVHSFGSLSGTRTEFWDFGPGPDVSFRRPATSLALDLTSEASTYLDELREVFPHRYAPSSGEILPLLSQQARFRAASGNGIDIELHSEVPDELLGPGADSLELGVYLLGSEGRRWTMRRERIPAQVGHPIRVRTPVSQGANRVVVEVYEPVNGLAAALTTPVSAVADGSGELQLSDVLVVAPSSQFSESALRRVASWLEPRTQPAMPEQGAAEIYFEIYDLPAGTSTYFLRVVLEELGSGRRTTVAFKPIGELNFERMWERQRRGGQRFAEYLTLDLSDVSSGSYLMRVEVSDPESDAVAESSRALEVR